MGNGKKLAITISFSQEDAALLEELIVRLNGTRTSVMSVAINLLHGLSVMNCKSAGPEPTYEDAVIPPHRVDSFKAEVNGGLNEAQRSLIGAASWPKGWLNKYGQWNVCKKKKCGWPKGKKRGPRKPKEPIMVEETPRLRVVK